MENLNLQIFPEQQNTSSKPTSIISNRSSVKKFAANIHKQVKAIEASGLLPLTESAHLENPLCNKTATAEQEHDLLAFREVGEEEFNKYVEYYVLGNASINTAQRKRKLATFAEKRVCKRSLTQLQKDIKLVQTCMHKKLLWSKVSNQPVTSVADQYIPLPLAISDNEGKPRKGQKSYTSTTLETRYKSSQPKVFLMSLPTGWTPDCCILEGMFVINTSPTGSHKTFEAYGNFLITRFIVPQWCRGATEVLDNPGRLTATPKHFERKRRDEASRVVTGHLCDKIEGKLKIPKPWRENVINCRACKRSLVQFLTKYFLSHASKYMRDGQSLLLAGGFEGDIEDTAWTVTKGTTPQPNPIYTCAAEETDTRLWLNVKCTSSSKILIMSPDTDIYHIGLPLQSIANKEIIVQLNKYTSKELKYFDFSAFQEVLRKDPDLSTIPSNLLPQVFQSLFVTTGCDYTSFFSEIGKATFYRYFYQDAEFISSGNAAVPGTLADINLSDDKYELGFLAFMAG